MVNKKFNKFNLILAVIIVLAVFAPWHQARAAETACSGIWMVTFPLCLLKDTAEAVTEGVGSLLNLTFENILAEIESFMLSVTQTAISWAADLFDSLIKLQIQSEIYDTDITRGSWTIIRNFVNLFFILILIIMAFGTIFSIQKYTWKKMLAPFLIAALLINFSFVIGMYIIQISNGLSSVFLKQMSTVSIVQKDGISGIFMEGTKAAEAATPVDKTGGLLIAGVFSFIFLVIFFLAMLAAAIFTLVRVFILWFLLIISPIAWFGYALPNLKSQTWSAWWKHFLCWCFWLPYFLFFLMFAVIFIVQRPNISPPSSIGNFMFYALSIIFLVGGMGIARKLACASGTWVGKTFGTIETGVRRYVPGVAYARGAYAGLKERGAEIKEKGILGIGGEQRARIQEARARGWLAPTPTTGEMERRKAEAAEVDKEIKKLQALNLTLDQLNERLTKGGKFEQIAAFKLKAENGWLQPTDLNEINKMLRGAGGGTTALGASIITSLKKGKFHEMAQTTAQKEFIFDNLQDREIKKAFGLDMAESKEIMDADIAKRLLDLYASDTKEIKDKVEKAVKNNIENMAKDKTGREGLLANPLVDSRIKKLVGQTMADKKEVDSWKLRRQILELNGGVDPVNGDALTKEGRDLAKDIKDGNTLFKEEGDYRAARGILPAVDLTPAQRTDVQRQIEANITSGLIRGLSAEEIKTPEIFNAINVAGATVPPARLLKFQQDLLGKSPDRKKRDAFAKALAGPQIPY